MGYAAAEGVAAFTDSFSGVVDIVAGIFFYARNAIAFPPSLRMDHLPM